MSESKQAEISNAAKPVSTNRRPEQSVRDQASKPPKRTDGKKRKSQSKTKNSRRKAKTTDASRKLMLIVIEITALSIAVLTAVIALLGFSAEQFSGTGFFSHLLPFAAFVSVLILLSSIILVGWWRFRKWLAKHREWLAAITAGCVALAVTWFAFGEQFDSFYNNFRILVGGKHEAERQTIAHQVYAAYRRYPTNQLEKMFGRARNYRQFIEEAAEAFDVDINLLQGIAAAESSFRPRTSSDGGHGLFQITKVPKHVVSKAAHYLNTDRLTLQNDRHNAFVAAATFKHYFAEMNNDLFLALLAYNIGPSNGGLRFIMKQYGVTDFATIQPYLKTLPRDYPIRVLSYALAFRLWQEDGKLSAYEEGNNAVHIQRIGIPGL